MVEENTGIVSLCPPASRVLLVGSQFPTAPQCSSSLHYDEWVHSFLALSTKNRHKKRVHFYLRKLSNQINKKLKVSGFRKILFFPKSERSRKRSDWVKKVVGASAFRGFRFLFSSEWQQIELICFLSGKESEWEKGRKEKCLGTKIVLLFPCFFRWRWWVALFCIIIVSPNSVQVETTINK